MAVILGIESSCDETAVGVVQERRVLGEAVASSAFMQAQYGGVVPEVAARAHTEALPAVMEAAMREASIQPHDVDAVAVTAGPGLLGSLLVGITAAKALAVAWRKPLVPVHHLEAHLYANAVDAPIVFPSLALLVSGGHTGLWRWEGHGRLLRLGETRDDAAGEAIDKGARLLGLPYPGGPEVERLAEECVVRRQRLPVAKLSGSGYDFSFSGLKTALRQGLSRDPDDRAGWASALLEAVAMALVGRLTEAHRAQGGDHLYVAGGVAANRQIRWALRAWADASGVTLHVPPIRLCTDNGVMVALAGEAGWSLRRVGSLDLAPRTSWSLGRSLADEVEKGQV